MDKKDEKEISGNTLTVKERYEILIRARNFHYENFNKWMSYFYVMIGSIILGFSYIISQSAQYSQSYKPELLILAILGFIVSLFWHWANKGYYYWNINFITLVNHYEKNLLKLKETERIYFVFANKENQNNYLNPIKGANISTSKISILLSYLFAIFFGSYATFLILKDCIICESVLLIVSCLFPVFTIAILSVTIARYSLNSYQNHFPDLKIDASKTSNYNDENNLTT